MRLGVSGRGAAPARSSAPGSRAGSLTRSEHSTASSSATRKGAAAHPHRRGGSEQPQRRSAVVDRMITMLTAAADDPRTGAELVSAVAAWVAARRSPESRRSPPPPSASSHKDPTAASSLSGSGTAGGKRALSASTSLNSSSKGPASTASKTLQQQRGASSQGSTGTASSSSDVHNWTRVFAAQVTTSLRTLGSITSVVRLRIECLTNLSELAGEAGEELSTATMDPDHPFVRSSLTLLPVVAYQFQAGELGTSKPALRVIHALMSILGTYAAPAVPALLRALLEAWAMPQHVTVQANFYRTIEAVAGSVADAPPVINALTAFHENEKHSKVQRDQAARLALQLIAATVASHGSIMRLKLILQRQRVSEGPVTVPFGTPIETVREAVAAAFQLDPQEDVLLVPPYDTSKPANARDITEDGPLVTLAAHPFASKDLQHPDGDAANGGGGDLPSRPPSPGRTLMQPSRMLSRRSVPRLTLQEPTPLKRTMSADDALSPQQLDATVSRPLLPSPSHPGGDAAADDAHAHDDDEGGPLDCPSPEAAAGGDGDGDHSDVVAAPPPLSVSIPALWRMFLRSCSADEQAQLLPCLYVLFPVEITELFNADRVPHSLQQPSSDRMPSLPLEPLSDGRRAVLRRALRSPGAPIVITTEIDPDLTVPCLAGALQFLVVRPASTTSRRGTSMVQHQRVRSSASIASFVSNSASGRFASPVGAPTSAGSKPPLPPPSSGAASPLPLAGSLQPTATNTSFAPQSLNASASAGSFAQPSSDPPSPLNVGGTTRGGGSGAATMVRRRSRTTVSMDMAPVVGSGRRMNEEWADQEAVRSPLPNRNAGTAATAAARRMSIATMGSPSSAAGGGGGSAPPSGGRAT